MKNNTCKYSCAFDPEWKTTVKVHNWEGFIECNKKRETYCDYRILFGGDLQMCHCPLGYYIATRRSRYKVEKMKNKKIVLIVSSDDDVQIRFSKLLDRNGISFVLEQEPTKALVRLLDMDVKLIIVDIDAHMINPIDFLHVVCKLRPKGPIMAITDEPSKDMCKMLTDEGVKYILAKQFTTQELSQVVELKV